MKAGAARERRRRGERARSREAGVQGEGPLAQLRMRMHPWWPHGVLQAVHHSQARSRGCGQGGLVPPQ